MEAPKIKPDWEKLSREITRVLKRKDFDKFSKLSELVSKYEV